MEFDKVGGMMDANVDLRYSRIFDVLLSTLGDDHFCAHLAARVHSYMSYLMVPHNWKPWYYKLDGVPSSSLTPSCNSMDASLRRRMMSNLFNTAYCRENCARRC